MIARLFLVASALLLTTVLVTAQTLPTFDVTTYGAVGDGKTDDTVAVGKATAALLASPTGGILFFPVGTFLLLEQPATDAYISLNLPNTPWSATAPSYDVVGSGASGSSSQSTIILYNSTVAYAISVTGGENVPAGTIAALAFVAYAVPDPTAETYAAINLDSVSSWQVEYVLVDVMDGVDLEAIQVKNSHTLLFRHLELLNVSIAIMAQASEDIIIDTVILRGSLTSSAPFTVGVWTAETDNLHVIHSNIQAFAVGAKLQGAGGPIGISFSNTVFFDSTGYGISIETDATVNINSVGFNVTNGPIATSIAGVYKKQAPYNGSVIISNAAFIGQTVGVAQENGQFTMSNLLFEGCGTGFTSSVPTRVQGTAGFSLFTLSHCVFEGITNQVAIIEQGSNYAITDNTCINGVTTATMVCTDDCAVEDNTGCTFGGSTSKKAQHQKLKPKMKHQPTPYVHRQKHV